MNCKICGAAAKHFHNDHLDMVVPDGYPLAGALSLSVCKSCGFVGNLSDATDQNYQRYYTDFNKHHTRTGALRMVDVDYFEGLLKFLNDETDFNVVGSTTMDYGSGALLFSDLATSKGARTSSNYDIGQGTPSGTYDLVISTHCFEHIADPVAALRECATLVATGGYLCIAVPDLLRYTQAYYGPYAHFDLEHINHFSLSSLSKLFAVIGFEPVAHRCVDRMVTGTLAYSEVLVVGKASSDAVTVDTQSAYADSTRALMELFDRSARDMALTVSAFRDVLASAQTAGRRRIGIYGVASHAFRFISVLKKLGLLKHIDFFADSDSRLASCTLAGRPILSKTQFTQMLKDQCRDGYSVNVLIVAVNAHRIERMFRDEFANQVQYHTLPPNCQNRDSIVPA
jgi:SAM-dependent methyltransferase